MILRVKAGNLHVKNISNGATDQKIQAPQDMMAWMQNVCNGGYEHFITYKQKEKKKLHEILSKFHIGYEQNEATVQKLRAKQEITTICQNDHIAFSTPHNYELHNSDKLKKGMARKRARRTTTNK